MKSRMTVMAFNWALIRYGLRPFGLHAVLQIFFLGSRVIPGLIEKAVFDTITGQSALVINLWALVALYGGIGLARLVSTYAETYAGWTFRYAAGALVRRNLFASLLRRPGAAPQPVAPGEAINRYRTDVGEVCDFPTWLPDVAGNLVSFIAAVAIMASIDVRITVVAFLPIIVAYGVGRLAWGRMLHLRKLEGEAGDRVIGFLADIFRAVQVLKVAGEDAEDNAVRHLNRLNAERRRITVQARMLDVFVYSIHSFAIVFSTGSMLLMASRGMIDGSFTVGDFALFTYFLWFTSEFPSYLGTFVGDFKQQEVAMSRLAELTFEGHPATLVAHHPALPEDARADWLLSSPTIAGPAARVDSPSLPSPDAPGTIEHPVLHELEVRGLTYRHDGPGRGVHDVSFVLRGGSTTVVTGQVGSGKTTLLRALLGLLPAQAGEVRWNGTLIEEPAAFCRPPRVAYTSQSPRLFSDTLAENITQGIAAGPKEIEAALVQAVLEQDVAQLEKGLETRVGPRGVRLSGGQVQRTAAARMFIRRPALIVVDDLSSALDVETEKALWDRLATPDRPTILAVSHRMATLQRADLIILLKDGRVDGVGSLQELLETSDEMRRIYATG